MDLFEAAGYRVNRLDIIWDFVPCYANRKYYNAINYNGDVLKCTACNDLYLFVSAVFYTDCHFYFAYTGAFMVHYNHLFESFLIAIVFRGQCRCFLCPIENGVQLKYCQR